jgi:hypothetical protein
MSKTTRRVLAVFAVLVLAGCIREPFPPYYAAPAPPPLQPYMGPPVYAPAPAPVRKRIVKRRYIKKRAPKVDCRCVPVQ